MGRTTKVVWDGNVAFEYKGKEYTADVTATASHWYSPGRMYMKNGDPGYPEENEIDDVEFEVQCVYDSDDEPVPYVEDMEEAICDAIYDQAEWEEDEPPEPDLDAWEDAQIAKYEAACERMGY